MIWADRLGVCLLLLWVLWFAVADKHDLGLPLFVFFVFAPWLVCRLAHYIFTGRVGREV